MAAEEKAKEIVNRLYDSLYKGTIIQPSVKADMARNEKAKACALICVDYIVGEILCLIGSEKYMWTENEKEIYNHWQSVKTEIEKL